MFQRLQKIARAHGASELVVFEKFTNAYLSQIARDKSFDHLLIMTIQVTIQLCRT